LYGLFSVVNPAGAAPGVIQPVCGAGNPERRGFPDGRPPIIWYCSSPERFSSKDLKPIAHGGRWLFGRLGICSYWFLGVLAQVVSEHALASLAAFSMMLAVCLIGGILYIFYRPKHR